MSIQSALQQFLTNPLVLGTWIVLIVLSLGVLVWDLRTNNEALGSLMKYVWGLTVLYSGPLGLAVYWFTGRTQISHDSLWRRSFRSVCHCYSGCGAGEITGGTRSTARCLQASHGRRGRRFRPSSAGTSTGATARFTRT